MTARFFVIDPQSIAANTKTTNLLVGTGVQFPPWRAKLILGATCAAVGLKLTWSSGSELQIDDQQIPIEAGVFPRAQDHFIFETGVMPMEEQVLTVRNSTVGAIQLEGIVIKAIPV